MLIVFDDMIADMEAKNTLKLLNRLGVRKINISLVLMLQSYFAGPKFIRLNATRYFFMKIFNKNEFQQIAFNHSSDMKF